MRGGHPRQGAAARGAEKRANRWDFDAVSVSSPELEALSREKLLQEINSGWHGKCWRAPSPPIAAGLRNSSMFSWQAYNTQAVKKRDLPERWTDLLEPRWRGMLGVEAKAGEWYCSLLRNLGEKKAAELFRQIAARTACLCAAAISVLANMVVSGEVPMALAVYSHMIDQPGNRARRSTGSRSSRRSDARTA